MDMILVYNCYDSLTMLIGPNDASKILGNDAACPICDQVLSKRLVLSNITLWLKCCFGHLKTMISQKVYNYILNLLLL